MYTLHGNTPRVLDLFCGAGGCSMGYKLAGFAPSGIDIRNQPHYPFAFVQCEALGFLRVNANWIRDNFTIIHASPPCQFFSQLKSIHKDLAFHDLIAQTRDLLDDVGLPYIIENVPGAKTALINPLMLCGTMFGLKLFRHRLFEIGHAGKKLIVLTPQHTSHKQLGLHAAKTSKAPDYEKGEVHSIYGHFSGSKQAGIVMGTTWMTRNEMSQAIPPLYTAHIGLQLLNGYLQ